MEQENENDEKDIEDLRKENEELKKKLQEDSEENEEEEEQEHEPKARWEDDGGAEVVYRASKVDPLDEAVFVIGHPRSGTSISCKILSDTDQVTWMTNTGSDQDNKLGYYEYGPFLTESVKFIQEQFDVGRMNKIQELMNNFEELANPPGLKMLHPHSWYNWTDFFKETKNLLVFREPSRCRKSHWKHKLNWPIDWFNSNNVLISIYEQAENSVFVNFDRLVSEPERVRDKIEEEIGIKPDVSVIEEEEKTVSETDVLAGDLENMVYEKLCELERAQYE